MNAICIYEYTYLLHIYVSTCARTKIQTKNYNLRFLDENLPCYAMVGTL